MSLFEKVNIPDCLVIIGLITALIMAGVFLSAIAYLPLPGLALGFGILVFLQNYYSLPASNGYRFCRVVWCLDINYHGDKFKRL